MKIRATKEACQLMDFMGDLLLKIKLIHSAKNLTPMAFNEQFDPTYPVHNFVQLEWE